MPSEGLTQIDEETEGWARYAELGDVSLAVRTPIRLLAQPYCLPRFLARRLMRAKEQVF